jgi:proteasome lid subunit RPN8/RPN11
MHIQYNKIIEYCKGKAPQEACGIVVLSNGKYVFIPCDNADPEPENFFAISGVDFIKGEEQGEVIAIVHSHPKAPFVPSDDDIASQALLDIPYLVIGLDAHPIASWIGKPPQESIPLYGREYIWNVTDCFTFLRDWYLRELNVTLPNIKYNKDFWEERKELYLDNFSSAGFVEVPIEEIQYGDALLMDLVGGITSHGAIYLGNNRIAHHLFGRLSGEDTLGRFFIERTTKVVRHRSKINDPKNN